MLAREFGQGYDALVRGTRPDWAPAGDPARVTERARRFRMTMLSAVVDGVRDLVRDMGVTPYTVLQTSFAWLIHRYTGERRFVLGMPAPGRLDPEVTSAVGYFVNPLPLVCNTDPGMDFRGHLRTFGERAAAAQAHQDSPYQRILENCVSPNRGADLIRILLLQQAPGGDALAGKGSRRGWQEDARAQEPLARN